MHERLRVFISSVFALAVGLSATSACGQVVIDMPPPPKPAKALPETTAGDNDAARGEVITWRDRRDAADLAGPQRSMLGTVALTRFARARSRSYNTYYVPPNRFSGYRVNFGFGRHYPFDVSFLHGVPTHWGGYDWPWSGFGRPFRFFGTW